MKKISEMTEQEINNITGDEIKKMTQEEVKMMKKMEAKFYEEKEYQKYQDKKKKDLERIAAMSQEEKEWNETYHYPTLRGNTPASYSH